MTIYDFIKKYENQTIGFPDGSYVGECLSLVKKWMQEKYGFYPPASGCNGARCYWSMFPKPLSDYFEKIPNDRDFVPKTDDIIIWNENAGGGFGHIGIVLNDPTHPADKQYFWSFDQNWGGKHAHLVRHNYNNVYGVLRPKGSANMSNIYKGLDLNNPEAMKPAVDIWYQVMIEKLWVKRDELKILFEKLGVDSVEKAVAEVQNRLDQVGRLKDELTAETKLRNELMQQAKDCKDTIKVYENNLVELKQTIDEQAQTIGERNRLIAELQKQANEGTIILPEPIQPDYVQLFFKWLHEKLSK